MKLSWKRTGPTEIQIRADPRIILILFGLPFLGIGLYLLSHVCGALWDVMTLKVSLWDNILGLTLLPLFAAAFLWPGLILVLARKRLTIDAAAGEVRETTSLRVVEWHRRHPIAGFGSVRAYQEQPSSRETDSSTGGSLVPQPFAVDLIPAAGRGRGDLTVGVADSAAGALELGRAVADLLKLPLVDDTGKDGEDYEDEGLRHPGGPGGPL